ncbi:MAG: hypothetical protein R3B96_02545 [Pirellulaceae bacterium]
MRRSSKSWFLPLVLLGALVLGNVCATASMAQQPDPIEQALAASRATGAPMLVIAGRETCPNCQNLLKQLGQRDLARLTTGVIPLKVNVDEPQWQAWAAQYGRPNGTTLPFVYLIRADGETLHSHSGPMDSAQLATVLAGQLQLAGRPINPRQAEAISQAVSAAEEAVEQEDPAGAVRELQPLKQLGELGQLGSFAEPALKADELVARLGAQVQERLGDVSQRIESEDDAMQACFDVVQAKRIFAAIPAIDATINPIFTELRRNRDLRETLAQAQAIDRAVRQCEANSTRQRGLEALQRIIDESPGTPAATLAQAQFDRYEAQ